MQGTLQYLLSNSKPTPLFPCNATPTNIYPGENNYFPLDKDTEVELGVKIENDTLDRLLRTQQAPFVTVDQHQGTKKSVGK